MTNDFASNSKVVKNVYKFSNGVSAGSICGDSGCGGREGGRPNFSVEKKENKNIVNKLLPPLPSWYVDLLGGRLMRYVPPNSSPCYNLLKSFGWRVVRGRRVAGFLPSTVFSGYIADRVADGLKFGRWLEVVAPPRSGKSAGVVEGLVRWLVENDVKNYTVLVVAANRRLAENLYKYVLGATSKIYSELKMMGVVLTRGDMYERVRVRLYLGSEASCLLSKNAHYVEDCIEKCQLFARYERKWRKLPPVPLLDPWLLKLCGYCPFISSSAKAFWYKSIVVVAADSLPYAIKNVLRHKIRRVVIVFDEYLVMLNKRGKVKQVDVKRLECMFKDVFDVVYDVKVLDRNEDGWVWVVRRLSLRSLFNIWNNAVKLLDSAAVNRYSKLVEGFGSGLRLADMINYSILQSVVDLKDAESEKGFTVFELVMFMYSAAWGVLDVARRIGDLKLSMKLRRMGYLMLNNAAALVSAVGFVNPLRGELEGVNRVVSIRWAEVGGEEYITGWAGGFVRSVVSRLVNEGIEVAVVSTSVDNGDVLFYRVYPHESLEHVRISLDAVVKRVESYSVPFRVRGIVEPLNGYESARTFSDLISYLSVVMNNYGNSVIVGSKSLIQVSATILRGAKYKCEEVGDTARGVVDYVVCDKPNGGKLLLVSPHSRASMGVDPPVSDPSEIILLYGLRRPTREYIKVKRDVGLYKKLVESWGIRVMSFGDNTYFVYYGDDVRYSYVFIYNLFASKYDVHMLIQVVGRWFTQRVERIFYNYKYDLINLKYFLVDYGIYTNEYAHFYVVRGFKRLGGFVKPVLEPHSDFASAVNSVLDYTRSRWTFEYVLEKHYKSMRRALKKLRKAGDDWEVSKAVAAVINGLEYAWRFNAPVPRCLKGVYSVFKEGGVEAVLNVLKEMGVNVWLVSRFMLHRMRAPVLE